MDRFHEYVELPEGNDKFNHIWMLVFRLFTWDGVIAVPF